MATPSEVYRRFGETCDVASLSGHVALAVSRSDPALQVLAAAPGRARRPAALLAALHDLAVAGRAPALAAAYAAGDGPAAAAAAVAVLLRDSGAVLATAARRAPCGDETGRWAALYPVVAAAAHRTGAARIGLVDVARPAALNLVVDRVCVRYDDGTVLGDPASTVQRSASVVGGHGVPSRPVPEVVARVGVDPDPLDVGDPDDGRWLRACVPPDAAGAAARLDQEIALAAAVPRSLVRGDPVDLLSEAVGGVPAGVLPVVTTTWVLSRWTPERRRDFLRRLEVEAHRRPLAWVSVEGVGVAPGVPTFGDRPASGHSILGVTVPDGSTLRSEAVGRCWRRGRQLAWLADR
ncbi:DUF2332 domain-containing protein [Nakamurella endophytica]|uniref:DUF2332 domain-containing protein n=1 Tax=Nakamurella endophytica TaxID=1748367 RepID=A0A917WIS2_9ACTN|nr:DUF2332 domain-containing protein [Nakamurella endophytica]GGM09064.1 hypothetical protein GCM10011594_31230 [Nakamurella endophytica]